MSYEASIKFAPVFTTDRLTSPRWARPGRCLYTGLRMFPGKTTMPLLIDHDDDREIGTVHELFRMDWTDGPWICARATVNAGAPAWLKQGTAASVGLHPTHSTEFELRGHKADVIYSALVSEVSVLSPGRKPAEPLAEVIRYAAAEPNSRTRAAAVRTRCPSPAVAGGSSDRRPAAAGNVVPIASPRSRASRPDFTDTEMRRRLEEADRFGPGAWEAEFAHMKRLAVAGGSLDELYDEHITGRLAQVR